MTLPTEPIGSIPRSRELMEGMSAAAAGRLGSDRLEALFDDAVRDTIRRFEETGSPVITDGEQRKPSFATYPIHGAKNLAPGGVAIKFKDGHERQLPVLNAGPFRYTIYAASYLDAAKKMKASGRSLPMYSIAGSKDMYKPLPVNDTPRSFYNAIRSFALLNDVAVPDVPDLKINEMFGLKLDGPGWSELAGRRVERAELESTPRAADRAAAAAATGCCA